MPAAAATTHTLEQAAALLGKKTDTLKKWFGQGCPHEKAAKGYRVDVAAVFDWRIAHERSLVAGDESGEVLVLELERAKLAKEQRIAAEMANAVRRGELVEASEVAAGWASIVQACKAKLLSLGSKVASRVSHPNQRLLAKEIDGEIKLVLKELSQNDRG